MMCLDVTCRKCAGEHLTQINGRAINDDQIKVVLRCDDCQHEFGMAIVLYPVPVDAQDGDFAKNAGCGTTWGYQKHKRNGMPACGLCKAAWADYIRKYTVKRKALAAA